MRPLLRPAASLAALAASLLAGGEARAQFTDGGTTTTSSFAPEDFFIRMQDMPMHTLSDFDVARWFNKARCDCSTPVWVYVALSATGLAKQATASTQGNLEVWLGTSCDDINVRGARCVPLSKTTVSAFLHDSAGRLYIPTDARMMSGQPNLGTGFDGGVGGGFPNPDCTMVGEQYNQTVWVLLDTDSNGSPDVRATQPVTIDLTAPPSPSAEPLASGNQALIVNWQKIDSALYPDIVGYQVLCNRGGDLQVFANSTFDPGFLSCTKPFTDGGIIGVDPENDGGVEALNPLFACSPLLSPTTTSFRIKILQNEITYGAAVVAIDRSGNASAPDVRYGAPIKTKSFYDAYRNDDPDHPGSANGGLCALGTGRVSGGTIAGSCAALALAAAVLAYRGRRRRRP